MLVTNKTMLPISSIIQNFTVLRFLLITFSLFFFFVVLKLSVGVMDQNGLYKAVADYGPSLSVLLGASPSVTVICYNVIVIV